MSAFEVWQGLTTVEQLAVEQRFCRAQNRTTFVTTDDTEPVKGIGRMLKGMLAFISKEVGRKDVPPQNVFAPEFTNQEQKAESAFSRFLNGKQHSPIWVKRGREFMSWLLTGDRHAAISDENADVDSLTESAKRIDHYFFRGDGNEPTYFSRLRLHTGEPWSPSELRLEINWFTREFASKGKGVLWYITGGPEFFNAENDPVFQGISTFVRAGGLLRLVYPSDRPFPVSNAETLKRISSSNVVLVPFESTGSGPVISMLTPGMRYLFAEEMGPRYLLSIRPKPSAENPLESSIVAPMARLGMKEEVEGCEQWARRIEDNWANLFQLGHSPSTPPSAIQEDQAS